MIHLAFSQLICPFGLEFKLLTAFAVGLCSWLYCAFLCMWRIVTCLACLILSVFVSLHAGRKWGNTKDPCWRWPRWWRHRWRQHTKASMPGLWQHPPQHTSPPLIQWTLRPWLHPCRCWWKGRGQRQQERTNGYGVHHPKTSTLATSVHQHWVSSASRHSNHRDKGRNLCLLLAFVLVLFWTAL